MPIRELKHFIKNWKHWRKPLFCQIWSGNKTEKEGVWWSKFDKECGQNEKVAGEYSWYYEVKHEYDGQETSGFNKYSIKSIQNKWIIEEVREQEQKIGVALVDKKKYHMAGVNIRSNNCIFPVLIVNTYEKNLKFLSRWALIFINIYKEKNI